jgi:HprK-related kinase A
LIVSELSLPALRRSLAGKGLRLRTGPVTVNVRSPLDAVVRGIALHYAQHPVESGAGFADFHVSVERPRGVRRWYRPQVLFRIDGDAPFAPLPGDQGFPLLEWGLNWCFSSHLHRYLILHAAVIERDGMAAIFPAPPGSGKSTLCAGLTFSGWRLLSDELAVIDPNTGELLPVPRPISLKNASIDALGRFAPSAVIGPAVHETVKGSVAHVQPPAVGVHAAAQRSRAAWVVLPRYVAGAPPTLEPLSKGAALMQLVDNAFNYHVHRRRGFDTLAALVDGCDSHVFSYSRLPDAAAVFEELFRARQRDVRDR